MTKEDMTWRIALAVPFLLLGYAISMMGGLIAGWEVAKYIHDSAFHGGQR